VTFLLDAVVWVAVLAVGLPLAVLAAESWIAAARRLRPPAPPTDWPSVAVLIPAHDEEAGLPRTLLAVMPQLRLGDRCLVVADNCTDGTAAVARRLGAEVLERHDPVNRGKGFALDAGLKHLSTAPPDVLVLVDADCDVAPGAVAVLAAAAADRPAQGINVLYPPPDGGLTARLSAFAFYFKNVIRPLGLAGLGGPCHLFGTGLAIPWRLLGHTRLATGNIVEDLQLGLDLAVAGHAARFLPIPCVSGELPSGDNAAVGQRTRWEHGHVRTLFTQAPRLVVEGIRTGRAAVLLLGLDLAVPPLSLLAASSLLVITLTGGWSLVGGSIGPLAVVLSLCGLVAAGVFAAWVRHGRTWVSAADLLRLPVYLMWKLPIYLRLVGRRQQKWVRAERSGEAAMVAIDGLSLHALDEAGTVGKVLTELEAGRGGWVATPNLDILRRYRRSPEFRVLLDQATVRVADGMPLVWAARLQGTPLPGRVAGSSLIGSLAAGLGAAGRSVYLLGGEPGAAAGAAEILRRRSPGLRVLGTSAPRIGDQFDTAPLVEAIRLGGMPDVVFVGLPSPKAERLIAALRPAFPATWFVGVGVSFSFLTGQVRRAPRWVQGCGMEWLFRLSIEPRRLARRYLVDGLPFAAGLFARTLVGGRRAT